MLIRSDARHIPLADESVHCVVTSPPYWGLRSYRLFQWEGGDPNCEHQAKLLKSRKLADDKQSTSLGSRERTQGPCLKCGAVKVNRGIGLEETFDEHLENLVTAFREVRRVLRKDGTLWLNYGDAYAGGASAGRSDFGSSTGLGGAIGGGASVKITKQDPPGLKPKDLLMMPARVAMALQADGWWLRSEIVWHKPNPMPESVTDRPTSSHEKVFLLSKAAKYFYDAEAVRVPAKYPEGPNSPESIKSPYGQGFTRRAKVRGHEREHEGLRDKWDGMTKTEQQSSGANLRNVWKIATQGVREAHFATFPEKLVEPCIKAGTSDMGCCPECGAPWVREVKSEFVKLATRKTTRKALQNADMADINSHGKMGFNRTETTGWSPTCDHSHAPIPCTVLDPFAGSGTVVRVAETFGLRGIGCDLDYQDIAKKRTSNLQRRLV